MKKTLRGPGLAACAALAALWLAQARSGDVLLYNHSPSMPVGIYVRIAAPPSRGAIVTVRAADVAPSEAAARGFDGPRDRFLKRVAARAGDVVCAEGAQIRINGRLSALRRSTPARTSPDWSGCRRLASGELLLLGDSADSFDGRYWGVIDACLVEGVWRAA